MALFFIYLLKSSALIAIFYICYRFVLARETFFVSNRVFLLLGVATAFLLPFWYLTKTVYSVPVTSELLPTTVPTFTPSIPVENSINWWALLGFVYVLGVLFFLGRLLLQLRSLRQLIDTNEKTKTAGFTIVRTTAGDSPFSFFNYIVFNPELYTEDALQTIIQHEKAHALQKHSLDLLTMHLLCIVQWFNPFAWGYKKSVGQNLEYLADEAATRSMDCKKEYQYLLLQQSKELQQNSTIINPFFNSLIKKRIVMINRTKSKQINAFKYAFILPFLLLFLFTVNTKIIAQSAIETKRTSKKQVAVKKSWQPISFVINKSTTEEELETYSTKAKEEGITLTFEHIDRNSKGEIIGIVSSYSDSKGSSGNWNLSDNTPIQPHHFYFKVDLNTNTTAMGYKPIKNIETTMEHSGRKQNNGLTTTQKTHIKGAVKQQIAQQPIEVEGRGRGDHLYSFLKPSIDQQPKLTLTGYAQEAQGKKPAYIIDGEIQDKTFKLEDVDPNSVESIHIFKGKKAKDKFGRNFENGVVSIITKNLEHKGWKVSVSPSFETDSQKMVDVTNFFTEAVNSPIVVVDGQDKGKDYKSIKIKEVDIESASLFAPSEKVSKKYGEPAKDGVLEIITKKGKQ